MIEWGLWRTAPVHALARVHLRRTQTPSHCQLVVLLCSVCPEPVLLNDLFVLHESRAEIAPGGVFSRLLALTALRAPSALLDHGQDKTIQKYSNIVSQSACCFVGCVRVVTLFNYSL